MALTNWNAMKKEKKYAMLGFFFDERKEYVKAFNCFMEAGNDPEVMEKIGEYYYIGRGVGKNYMLAKKYFKLAADAGNVDGMYNYACCERDNKIRYEYYLKAAEKGCIQASNMIKCMIKYGEIKDDIRLQESFNKENLL